MPFPRPALGGAGGPGVSKARVSVFVVVAGMIMASMASPAWAELLGVGADWQMDETSGTTMIDTSGNNNNGTSTDVVHRPDLVTTGSTYEFNGSTAHVDVLDAASLNPADKDITLTARVLVNNSRAMDDDSYDIVRKGFVTTPGGDYKMEILQAADPTVGKLHCFFRGDQASVKKVATRDIVDGKWHTLQCSKTSTSIVATVDLGTRRERSFTKTGSAGKIANASDVMVGGKTVDPSLGGPDDMFDGWMDFVSIDITQPVIAQ
jgi:hypothetical protein